MLDARASNWVPGMKMAGFGAFRSCVSAPEVKKVRRRPSANRKSSIPNRVSVPSRPSVLSVTIKPPAIAVKV